MPTKVPKEVDKHVGSRIKMRRLMLNISQETLGDKIGLTFQQIQKYEKGVNRVGSSRLHEISTALDCPVEWFFDGLKTESGDKVNDDFVTAFLSTSHGITIARAFPQLERKVQQAITALVQHIAGIRK